MAKLEQLFPEFYQKKIDEKGLKNSLIILDTNYLLEIVQLPTEAAKKYIKALEKMTDRIYIPYLVALEFNFNKSNVKKNKVKNIQKYKQGIEKELSKVQEAVEKIEQLGNDKKIFTEKLSKMVSEYNTKIMELVDSEISNSITKDEREIYEKLVKVIGNKIGGKYEQKWIDSVETEGRERYENKIPPGFNDSKKDDEVNEKRHYDNLRYSRKYGDLIIWKDILEYTKKHTEFEKVIFVTNDGKSNKKNDLLYKVGDFIIGPNVYLMNELRRIAGKELHIMSNVGFVKLVNKLTDDETKQLKSTSEKLYRIKIPEDKRAEVLKSFLDNASDDDEYVYGITPDGFLFKREKISDADKLYKIMGEMLNTEFRKRKEDLTKSDDKGMEE